MKPPQADSFEQRARDLYRRAGPHVDAATAARLRTARTEALTDGRRRAMRWTVPAGACAVAVLAVIALWQPLHGPSMLATMAPGATSQAEASQVLPPDADQTDPALYQDLGFYTWLAQQPSPHHAATRH